MHVNYISMMVLANNAFFKITYFIYVLTFKATKLEQKLFPK